MDVSRADNIYSSYHPETKIWMAERTYDRGTNRHIDSHCDAIIPRHYRMAGYKKGISSYILTDQKTDCLVPSEESLETPYEAITVVTMVIQFNFFHAF